MFMLASKLRRLWEVVVHIPIFTSCSTMLSDIFAIDKSGANEVFASRILCTFLPNSNNNMVESRIGQLSTISLWTISVSSCKPSLALRFP